MSCSLFPDSNQNAVIFPNAKGPSPLYRKKGCESPDEWCKSVKMNSYTDRQMVYGSDNHSRLTVIQYLQLNFLLLWSLGNLTLQFLHSWLLSTSINNWHFKRKYERILAEIILPRRLTVEYFASTSSFALSSSSLLGKFSRFLLCIFPLQFLVFSL